MAPPTPRGVIAAVATAVDQQASPTACVRLPSLTPFAHSRLRRPQCARHDGRGHLFLGSATQDRDEYSRSGTAAQAVAMLDGKPLVAAVKGGVLAHVHDDPAWGRVAPPSASRAERLLQAHVTGPI